MQTIESLRNELQAWRRAHGGRRGPLPLDLRRRVGALATELGDEQASAALDLRRAGIRRWAEQYGAQKNTKLAERSGPAFFELKPEISRGVFGHHGSPQLFIEAQD